MEKHFYKKQNKIKIPAFRLIFRQYMKKLFLRENIGFRMKCRVNNIQNFKKEKTVCEHVET
jgi:hypothetical protein